jgi:hypothetical protein
MQQKDLKIHIEKSFRFCKSENVEKEFTQLKTYIKLLNEKKEEFILKVITGEKTHPQLKAFYSARDQLLSQFNKREEERGELPFCKEQFKYALKIVGKWYIEKNNQFIPKSFDNISKDDMMQVLDNINKWAMSKGFSLCIDRELMDLIK